MKEKIKSWTLFLLIGLSLFLTVQILMAVPNSEDYTEGGEIPPLLLERTYTAAELFQPKDIMVYFGNEISRSVRYQEQEKTNSYAETSKELYSLLDKQLFTFEKKDSASYDDLRANKAGVELVYDYAVTKSLLSGIYDTLNAETTDKIFSLLPDGFHRMFLVIDNAPKVCFLNEDKNLLIQSPLSLSEEDGNLLKSYLEDDGTFFLNTYVNVADGNLLSDETPLYLPIDTLSMPTLTLKNEDVDDRDLARSLFPNFAFVRNIKEREAEYYLDGQRGLRFYHNGLTEYKDSGIGSESEPVTELIQLETALAFINQHGGFSGNFYLKEIIRVPESGETWFYFSMRYENFDPVNINPIYIGLKGQHVMEYARDMKVNVEEWTEYETLMQSFDIIDLLIEENIISDESPLKSMALTYFYVSGEGESKLIPAWNIMTDGSEEPVYVDAVRGTMLS